MRYPDGATAVLWVPMNSYAAYFKRSFFHKGFIFTNYDFRYYYHIILFEQSIYTLLRMVMVEKEITTILSHTVIVNLRFFILPINFMYTIC